MKKLFGVFLTVMLLLGLVKMPVKAKDDKIVGNTYPFQLPELKYAYNALEPYIDSETMKIHHDKHHKAYIDNLNKSLEKYPELQDKTLEYLLSNLEKLPKDIKEQVRNNAGGHYNHTFFWEIMGPKKGGEATGDLKAAIDKTFGSFDKFKEAFKKESLDRFGSGWAWLVKDDKGNLKIVSTPNQDGPVLLGVKPIIGIDVWEHAYYLKYQNKRAEYIDSWWNVVNWDKAEELYKTK